MNLDEAMDLLRDNIKTIPATRRDVVLAACNAMDDYKDDPSEENRQKAQMAAQLWARAILREYPEDRMEGWAVDVLGMPSAAEAETMTQMHERLLNEIVAKVQNAGLDELAVLFSAMGYAVAAIAIRVGTTKAYFMGALSERWEILRNQIQEDLQKKETE